MRRLYKLIAVLAGAIGLVLFPTMPVLADSLTVNFESPTYTTGVINGVDGWSSFGAAGSGCALYDHAVSSSLGTTGFGAQSLRISNAVVSGCFGDQTFSKSLAEAAGETGAQGDSYSSSPTKRYFQAQFDLASTVPNAQQPGLFMSVSPDRGDGARMSYLRFEDRGDGIHVFFDDYQDAAPFGGDVTVPNNTLGCGNEDDFVETDIATLDRSQPHQIKFVMKFIDGPRNDEVRIYIDGNLKKTGTSWEDYFRYCEGNPTRTVDSLLFRTGGGGLPAAPANVGKGFLIDNLKLKSFNPYAPTSKDDCKEISWTYLVDSEGKSFKNQGDCVSYVATKGKNPAAPTLSNKPTF